MKTILTNIWLWFAAVVFTAIVICSLAAMAASFFNSAYRFIS